MSRATIILLALVALAGCTVEQRYETIYLERGGILQTDQKTGAVRICTLQTYGKEKLFPECGHWFTTEETAP